MTQCRIILELQPITKLYVFTIELKLRDDFRCFRSKMCFRTFSTESLNSPIPYVGRCGVVGSTLAFGSIGHGFVRIRAPLIFTSWCISLQQAEITGEVLTGRFSSSTAVVHSASYPSGRANRVAAYQW